MKILIYTFIMVLFLQNITHAKIISIIYGGNAGTQKVAEYIKIGINAYSDHEVYLFKDLDLLDSDSNDYTVLYQNNHLNNESWDILDKSDAILFGAPSVTGTVSGAFKLFMETTYTRRINQKWKDKFAAGFTSSLLSSGGKLNTITTLSLFASQHSMIWISVGVKSDGSKAENINRFGSSLGMMINIDSNLVKNKKYLSSGDIKTAKLFGKRIGLFLNNVSSFK